MRQPNSHLSFTIHAAAPARALQPGRDERPEDTSVQPKGVSPGEKGLAEPGPAEPARLGWARVGLGCRRDRERQWLCGCRMDRVRQRELGCRMDRGG